MQCELRKPLSITWGLLQDKGPRNPLPKFLIHNFGRSYEIFFYYVRFNDSFYFSSHYSVPPNCPISAAEASVKMYHNSIFLGGDYWPFTSNITKYVNVLYLILRNVYCMLLLTIGFKNFLRKCNQEGLFLGRYNKYSRELSQTPWLIDGIRKMDTSLEELISESIKETFKFDGKYFNKSYLIIK